MEWLVIAALLCGANATPPSGTASACRDRELGGKFVAFASPSYEYSPAGLEEAFRPHAGGLEMCLKRWVEDGGEKDGVPLLGNGGNRERYRVFALVLLGQLYPRSEEVASWIRSNVRSWPTALQDQAVNTLGEIGSQESFPFLKAEARRSGGPRQERIWRSLLLLDSQRFATELESIAGSREEQMLLGKMLMERGDASAVPALRKLKKLVPEKASMYEGYIREIEKAADEERDHEN